MRETAEHTLGPSTGSREMIARHQNASQIIQQMRRAEKNSRTQSLALAPQFSKGSQMETARGVYNFIRHGMDYRKESNNRQTAKEIRRYIDDGYGDCKHMSTFTVGLLNACKIPAWFVLVSQRQGSKNPTHAYACCMIGQRVVVIDGCRPKFDDECIHFYKYNIPAKK